MPNAYYFEFELDDEPGALYGMRYDSVLLYVDEEQPGFSCFCLPMLCLGSLDDEMVRVRVLCGKNGGTMVDDDFTDEEVDDGDNDVDFFDSHDDAVDDTDDADDGSYSKGAPATRKKRKKGAKTKTGGKRATKRSKTRGCKNTTINPDLVLHSGEVDAKGEEGDADGYSRGDDDSNLDNDCFEEKRYEKNEGEKLDEAHRGTTGEGD